MDRRVFIIDAEVRGTAKVGGKVIDDILVHNFFRMLYGILTYRNVSMQDSQGKWYIARLTGDLSHKGYSAVAVCNDVDELDFNAYTCDIIEFDTTPSSGLVVTETEAIATAAKTVNSSGPSAAYYQGLFDVNNNAHSFLLAHIAKSVNAGLDTIIEFHFKPPFVKGIAAIIAAIISDLQTIQTEDTSGNTFTLNGLYQLLAGAARILLGTGTNPVTPNDFNIQNPIEITTNVAAKINENGAMIVVRGAYIPDTDITINEMGVVISVKDPDGNNHDVLVMRHVFPSPITLSAGKTYIFGFRIAYP